LLFLQLPDANNEPEPTLDAALELGFERLYAALRCGNGFDVSHQDSALRAQAARLSHFCSGLGTVIRC
jgi:hypothetical protein